MSGSERSTSVLSSRSWTGGRRSAEVERAVEQAGDLRRGEQLAAQVEHDAGQLARAGRRRARGAARTSRSR